MEFVDHIATSENSLLVREVANVIYKNSIKQLWDIADVARNTYYEACKKPGSIEAKNKILNKVFDSLVPEVKRAATKFAIDEVKNFQDRKMILKWLESIELSKILMLLKILIKINY